MNTKDKLEKLKAATVTADNVLIDAQRVFYAADMNLNDARNNFYAAYNDYNSAVLLIKK